jgi:uncharacterized protein (DUF924 family)
VGRGEKGDDEKGLADEVLELWFGEAGRSDASPDARVSKEVTARWFKPEPAFDREIRERFGDVMERASRGELDSLRDWPRGALALVILCDQFPRNAHRGTPEAFALDDRALAAARHAIDQGFDRKLPLEQRLFFYMPLMHAESRRAQADCVDMFEQALAEAPEDVRDRVASFRDFAIRHQAIVDRFGRYPHRNAILGRPSTPEEEAFLREPGSSF